MDASQMSYADGRRHATVLFADLSGSTALGERMDPEDVAALMNRCFTLLESAVVNNGGTVVKFIGDCVHAVFGAPTALEDAPRNAVNAAIEMRRSIQHLVAESRFPVPLDIHIGINTGLVVAGDVGGVAKRAFDVMGDAVNLAARLKDLSPHGAIWVGAETYRYTRDAFDCRPLSSVKVKGKNESVPVFEVRSERQELHRSRSAPRRRIWSSLVGRDDELVRLRQAVAALHAGRGGVVSLVGEAGLGKTRLVAELAVAPEAWQVTFLEGRSLSIAQTLGFHPFVDLLRSWAVITEDQPPAEWAPRLEAAVAELLGGDASDVFPFVATLMGVPLADAARARLEGIAGDALDQLVRRSMKELLQRLAGRRPLVLVFEDLHWADQSSISLLESLLALARDHPILFLGVFRPDFAETSQRVLETARRAYADRHLEVSLEPLGLRHRRAFLDNLFGRGDLPVNVRTLILERAGGNPFYLEEVIHSLIDEGAVTYQQGTLRATEKIRTVSIPGTIRAVIMARIDRLPPEPKNVFQIASVIGRSFDHEILAELVPEKGGLDDELDFLVELELLVRDHGYSFKHALIQEVAYESILRTRRGSLHRRVAEVIEGKHSSISPPERAGLDGPVAEAAETRAGRMTGVNGMLAYHFGLAGELDRAEAYLFKAGEEAARAAASNEALHFFREASRLYLALHGVGADRQKQALLQKNIGLALFNRGQLIEAAQNFDHALGCLGEKVPRRAPALLLRFARSLSGVLWRVYVRRGVRPPPASDAARELIALMYLRAQAQTTADPARFLFDTMENLHKLVRVDPRTVPHAGGMYASAVGIFSFGGLSFRIGRRFLELASPLVDASDVRELFLLRFTNYLHHVLSGDWSEEHAIDEALVEQNLRLGSLWSVTSYLGLDVERKIHQGRFAEARTRLARIRNIEETYGYDLAKSNRLSATALLALEQRELVEALDAAEAYYAEHEDALLNVNALGVLAKVQVMLGRLGDAETTLARAGEIVRHAGRVPPFHRSTYLRSQLLLQVARLAAGTGDERAAARTTRRAIRVASKVAWSRPEIYRLAGEVARLRGRPRTALRWFGRSLVEGERLAFGAELARSYGDVAPLLAAGGVLRLEGAALDAETCRARARAIFQRLGLERELARLDGRVP